MTDYPIWDNQRMFDMTKERSDGRMIAHIFMSLAMSAIMTKRTVYGDVDACLSAKSIFATWDDNAYFLHPINDDEEEMALRIMSDRCEKMYERDIFALTDGPPCE